jgi:hypothetical protein
MPIGGYMGRVLRVNLTDGKLYVEICLQRMFLGSGSVVEVLEYTICLKR